MAIINPVLCRFLSIQVEVEQKRGGIIPFLCCYHNKSRLKSECVYIRLDKAEYVSFIRSKKLSENKKAEYGSYDLGRKKPCHRCKYAGAAQHK